MDKKEIVKKYKIEDYFLFVNFQNFEQGFHFPLKQKLKKEDKLLLFRDINLSFASQQNICSVDNEEIDKIINGSLKLSKINEDKIVYNININEIFYLDWKFCECIDKFYLITKIYTDENLFFEIWFSSSKNSDLLSFISKIKTFYIFVDFYFEEDGCLRIEFKDNTKNVSEIKPNLLTKRFIFEIKLEELKALL